MIDLRSDTVTKPTEGMLNAMMHAPVGDDVFGEDPSINALEDKVATMFGQEAGLFVPSGTMSNQLSVNALTSPGDEVILDIKSHIFNYESAAAGLLSGVQLYPLSGKEGKLTPELIETAVRTRNDWDPFSRVIALENTTNKGGGAFYSLDEIKAIREVADKHDLYLHLDGARVWNALVESGYSAHDLGSFFDTISVCFSKGLGAPVGSMMLSTKDRIRTTRRTRKMLGGGMRQAGILAAAAEYTLENHLPKLREDHRKAKIMAEALAKSNQFSVNIKSVYTNILLFDTLNNTAAEMVEKFAENGILLSVFGPKTIRAVFHFQITQKDLDKTVETIKNHF